MKKQMIAGMAAAMICVGVIGGTFAWLTSEVETVTNTFTVGNVNISLAETSTPDDDKGIKAGTALTGGGYNYKLFPGSTYSKAPVVTVTDTSETCYVFIKVENGISLIETATQEDKIAAQITSNGWEELSGHDGYYVYSSMIENDADDKALEVFDTFTIAGTVDNDTLADYADAEVVITACAIQAEGFATAEEAFAACPAGFTGISATE